MNADVCLALHPPGTEIAESGLPSLWDVVATASFKLINVGKVTAAEVSQLYIGIPGGPEKVLRGFAQKKTLLAGQRINIQFNLTRRDLSAWDIVSQSWILQTASYNVYIGASVLDIKLVGSVEIGREMTC